MFFRLLWVTLFPFSPALASPRFRLAGLCLAFSLWKLVSDKRVVFVRGGRPNGMVQLLFETVSLSGAFVKTTALAVACLWPDFPMVIGYGLLVIGIERDGNGKRWLPRRLAQIIIVNSE